MLTYATVCQHCNDQTILHLYGPQMVRDPATAERDPRRNGSRTALVFSPSRCMTCDSETWVSFRLAPEAFRDLAHEQLRHVPAPEQVDDGAFFAELRGDLRRIALPESIELGVMPDSPSETASAGLP